MDIRNLLQGKELSVCLLQGLYNFHFYKPGSRTQYLRLSAPVMFRFPRKKNSVTLSYKVKLHNPKDSNLPPNDTTRWQQPSCYFIPFNVLSPTDARNQISALRGLCSNQLNYRTKIINKIFKFRAMLFTMLKKQGPLLKYYI